MTEDDNSNVSRLPEGDELTLYKQKRLAISRLREKLPQSILQQVRYHLVLGGGKVIACKIVMDATGSALYEAKLFVDDENEKLR